MTGTYGQLVFYLVVFLSQVVLIQVSFNTSMELLRSGIILLSLSVLVFSSVKNKPKCIENFLKDRVVRKDEDRRLEPGSEEINLQKVLRSLDGPTSELLYLRDIPSHYKQCQYFAPGTFYPDPSLLIDFNNGRLGNQMSSLASIICLATEMGLKPMMIYKNFKFLNKYFTNITSRVEILESRLCSPWSDVKYTALDKRTGTKGEAQFYLTILE